MPVLQQSILDTDIQFGEIEQESPRQSLRPDRNRHFAVVAYGEPAAGELPIFVDLDVIRDMEAHAASDTSVELGGVLLGGHFEDEEGQPFVVVSDSLRATHYESTKGSFKFTHDTWSAITREREQFPIELQMAGWYHTHPDWGVFLSGMDMFICDNFFNKQLDVAYVIDPCRGDRGMFQWTGDPRERVRRTGGFYVTASRFRQAELESYVLQLEGKAAPMPSSHAPPGYPAPIVHLPPPPPPPAWQLPAVLGALALQACLLALLAWKAIVPGEPAEGGAAQIAARLDAWVQSERIQEREATQRQVLDAVLGNLKGTEPGFAARLEKQLDKSQDLALDVNTYRAQLAAQKRTEAETQARLAALERDFQKSRELLNGRIDTLQKKNDLLAREKLEVSAKLAALQDELEPDEQADPALAGGKYTWWILGGSLAALVVIAGAAVAFRRPVVAAEEAAEQKDAQAETNTSQVPE